jgi:hypothetical protein
MDATFDTTDCKPLTERGREKGRERERKERRRQINKNIAQEKKN